MKNLITILAVLLLPALAFAQFPNAPSKVVIGRQTTALGTVYHKAGLPAFTPTNWRNDVSVVIDTLTDITWKWSWDASEWQAQGVFFSAIEPPSLTVSGGASHNYTKAIWQAATGLLSYYDQTGGVWRAIAGGAGGADSIAVLQDSIVAIYLSGIELSRDTIGFPAGVAAQNLSFSGDTLSISGGNSVVLPYSSEIADTAAAVRADFPVVADNQTISLSNDSLSIERGNTLYLPYTDAIIDTAAAIRGDFPVDTDAQNLSLSNDTLSIERGNSLFLPYAAALIDTAAAIRADIPIDSDVQNISLSNDTLSIERGNSIFLPYAAALADTAADLRALIQKPPLVVTANVFILTRADMEAYGSIIFTSAVAVTVAVDTGLVAGSSIPFIKRGDGALNLSGINGLVLSPTQGKKLEVTAMHGVVVVRVLLSTVTAVVTGDLSLDHCTLTASGGTVTWNAASCKTAKLTLAGDYTLAITNAREAEFLTVNITQDATGGRTLAWPTGTRFQGGTPLAVSTAANAEDVAIFYTRASGFNLEIGKGYAE